MAGVIQQIHAKVFDKEMCKENYELPLTELHQNKRW